MGQIITKLVEELEVKNKELQVEIGKLSKKNISLLDSIKKKFKWDEDLLKEWYDGYFHICFSTLEDRCNYYEPFDYSYELEPYNRKRLACDSRSDDVFPYNAADSYKNPARKDNLK